MTTAGPWSVKGIDPKARELAKDLARRSGLTLGEWLNQMIVDGADEPAAPYSDTRDASPPRAWADEAARAFREPAAAPVLNADSFRSRLREAGRGGGASADEIARVTRAMAELTAKVEAAEHRSTLAISGIDQQTLGVLSRMEGVERDQTSVAARFDGALEQVREVQDRLAERLRRMEGEEGPRVEAMKALEGALGKVAAQIYEGESRTRAQSAEIREDLSALARRMERAETAPDTSMVDAALARLSKRMEEAHARTDAAVKALEHTFAGLDARLGESEEAGEASHRFETLAAELTERVESTRAEMSARLEDAADGKLDRMESVLRDLSGQVAESEKRSAVAIDRMGREVVRIAKGLDSRVGEVEQRAQASHRRMEGDMARVADAVEARLSRADSAQAEALEKLGGEIARIAEKLTDRIAASERRSAQDLSRGLDEVGDKLGRVTDKLNDRYDHAAADLAERIRASEERTVRLLAEARASVDAGAAASVRPAIDAVAAYGPEAPAFGEAFDDSSAIDDEPFDIGDLAAFRTDTLGREPAPRDTLFAEDEDEVEAAPSHDLGSLERAFEPGPFGRPTLEDSRPFDHAEDTAFAADDDFASLTSEPPPAAAPAARPSTTRELIEQARAAARANAEAKGKRPRAVAAKADTASELFSTPAPGFEEAEAPARAPGASPTWRLRRKEGSTLKTALGASGVAAVLSLGASGAVWMLGEHAGRASTTTEAPTAAPTLTAEAAGGAPTLLAVAETPGAPTTAQAAAASDPGPARTDLALATSADSASARSAYNQAVQALERGDAGGVDLLKRAANLGYAPAQFHLGKLYEDGGKGLKKDMGEARRWTERAARAGDAKAMFNLGLYLANGEGAVRDDKAAVEWFRRAADGGVRDAQFNLAVMNQNGRGAPASPAEAYKWFLIAAADGDVGARASAEALKPALTLDAQTAAERSAAAYRAQIAATASAAQVRTASR